MAPQPDVENPADDPFSLVGSSWPVERESAYHAAEVVADDAETIAGTQAHSASDAEEKTDQGMQGKTADSVSNGYGSAATRLVNQSQSYRTVSGWMSDAASKIRGAKKHIANLVHDGTQEIKDAIESELAGAPVTPSSSALTDKYRGEISSVATTLAADLDGIGHSLAGDPGASHTPTYVRAAASTTTPSIEQAAVHHGITGEGPHVEPQKLPEMPRATSAPSSESPSALGTPSAPTSPHIANPTLANLIAGNNSPSGTGCSPSTSSPHGSASGTTPAGQGAQAHQPSEHRQDAKSAGLPRIPSIPLPDLLPAAAESIATGVSAASGTQLPVASGAPAPTPQVPASTGVTPGVPGPTPMPAGGLSPIGGVPTPTPTVQAPPAVQGTPASPPPGVQTPSAPQTPASAPAPRGPVADIAWLQQRYGLAPGLDLPKPENPVIPALFITELPAPEAHLHRALATIRQQFQQAGWAQPLAVANIRRGLEARTVYVTADAISIHPHGVLLPNGVVPLDEIAGVSSTSVLSGSLTVTDKLAALIPRGWEIEALLSTVSGGKGSQSTEQFQELVESGELLPCTKSRGREDVSDDEAMRVFARAAIASAGCGELDVESARLQGARWVGPQPQGYVDVLARWYLSDAAESMSRGSWAEAVYASEKYMNLAQSKSQVA